MAADLGHGCACGPLHFVFNVGRLFVQGSDGFLQGGGGDDDFGNRVFSSPPKEMIISQPTRRVS